MTVKLSNCLDTFWQAAAPRRALTVSAWADEHRELSGKQAGERGRWRTSRTPFLREIMDCLSANSRVQDIVVMKSSQVGVTEATVNFLGYVIDHAPAPVMVLMPTLESRDAWKAQKLNPLLTETPSIRALLGGQRSRDAANRQDMIDFPGGVLFLAGGNSPNSYAQRSVRYLIMDDLDRFPPEVGEEGDVVTLAKGRTKAFARARRMFISTPTVRHESLIEREWLKSDQRRYHVPCPHCGEYQPLEWGGPEAKHGVKWTAADGAVTAAWYVCAHCSGEVLVKETDQMVENTGGDRPDVSSRHAAGRSNAKARNATEIQQREAPAFSGEQIGNSIAASRAIKEKYAALTAKIDYETKMGALVPREDVDAAMRFIGAAVRSALDVLPDQTAPLVAPITDMAEIHEVLAEACRNTLQNVNATIARQQSKISKEPA